MRGLLCESPSAQRGARRGSKTGRSAARERGASAKRGVSAKRIGRRKISWSA